MAAAGCQVIIFTTGRETPTGNAIVPVLKVTANEHTYSWMEDNMDVDVSGIIRGEQTIEESGGMLLEKLHEIANGNTACKTQGDRSIANLWLLSDLEIRLVTVEVLQKFNEGVQGLALVVSVVLRLPIIMDRCSRTNESCWLSISIIPLWPKP